MSRPFVPPAAIIPAAAEAIDLSVSGNTTATMDILPLDLTVKKKINNNKKMKKQDKIKSAIRAYPESQPTSLLPVKYNGDENSDTVMNAATSTRPPVFRPIIFTSDYNSYFTAPVAKRPPPALPLSLPDPYPLMLTSYPIEQYRYNFDFQQLLIQIHQNRPDPLPQSVQEKEFPIALPQKSQPLQLPLLQQSQLQKPLPQPQKMQPFQLPLFQQPKPQELSLLQQPQELSLLQQPQKTQPLQISLPQQSQPQTNFLQQLLKYDNNALSTADSSMIVPEAGNQFTEYRSSSSTVESNCPSCSYDSIPRTNMAVSYKSPYFGGLIGSGGYNVISGTGRGFSNDGGFSSTGEFGNDTGFSSGSGFSSGDQMDYLSTSPPDNNQRQIYHDLMAILLDDSDVNPEDIEAIYRDPDYLSFRNQYLKNLGPPKNYDKMRRSVPSKRVLGGGFEDPEEQRLFEEAYAERRRRNNESAKKSRHAKQQKYLENQISIKYLSKTIEKMNEIKRQMFLMLQNMQL